MPADQNTRRATRGRLAVTRYIPRHGAPHQECLTDLLADLRHFAADAGLDFDAADRIAADHFDAESAE